MTTDDIQGALAARWMHTLGVDRLFLIDDGSPYGEGLVGIVGVTARDLGLEVVGYVSGGWQDGDPEEAAADVARVLAANPDLLYVGGGASPGTLTFLQALRREAPELSLMGADALLRTEVLAVAAALEGLRVTSPGQLDPAHASPAGLRFLARYRERFGEDPLPVAVTTYEATRLALLAIAQAESPDRAAVLAALHGFREIEGPLGRYHFDAAGDTSLQQVSALQLQGGAWRFVRLLHQPP
jgi:branched-chain amino acid transport system substrate-binding protein